MDILERIDEAVALLPMHTARLLMDARNEIAELRDDRERIDWLGRIDNEIGNVTLPKDCVSANLGSLRMAIDCARLI